MAEEAKRKALAITSKNQSEKQEADKTATYIYDKRNETFAMKITNSSSTEVKELEAKYDIYVSRFDKEGKKTVEVVSGKESISNIAGSQAHEFVSAPVEVTLGCETTSNAQKDKTHAASVKTERVVGIHVQLYDKEGNFLNEHYSSNAVKSAVLKQVREEQKNEEGE